MIGTPRGAARSWRLYPRRRLNSGWVRKTLAGPGTDSPIRRG